MLGKLHPPILGDGPPKKRGMMDFLLPMLYFWGFLFLNPWIIREAERKSGWQKWELMSFFVRACWGITYNHRLSGKKHPSWCFCAVWGANCGILLSSPSIEIMSGDLEVGSSTKHRIFFDWWNRWIGAEVLGEMRSVFKQQAMWAMCVLPVGSGVAKFGEPS